MFEAAELGRSVSKQDFKEAVPELRLGLLRAQRAARKAGIPVVVIIAGVSGAGKGEVVNRLFEWLDSRGVRVHAYWDETDEEKQRPRWWRFWRTMPAAGRIGILFGGWYTEPIVERVLGKDDDDVLEAELVRIADTERMLVRGGALVVKFWCHLPEQEQAKRIKEQRKDPHSHWRMAPETVQYAKHYSDFLPVCEHVLRETDTGEAPWYLIEATDRRYRDLTIGRTLLKAIETRLAAPPPDPDLTTSHAPALPEIDSARVTVLDHVDLSLALDHDEYREQMEHWQAEVNRLTWKAFRERRPCVVAFEGWDAAGKGGAIRRLIQAMDARLYHVEPFAAPTDEEKDHHYLWRFWRRLPRDGYCTLFDRSWYGRVLVERVEGYATPAEWARAYHEINDFEAQLADHGMGLLKFWLHIDEPEQLQRFTARENTAYKRHKITGEDWRNREKWGDYKAAVNEMVVRTSTEYAPWHLIPANDKRYARVTVLRTFAEVLQKMLD
ncbi:MAG: polyphosphate:AMP phosphotransferase [Gammaproteobacteria bacterium]